MGARRKRETGLTLLAKAATFVLSNAFGFALLYIVHGGEIPQGLIWTTVGVSLLIAVYAVRFWLRNRWIERRNRQLKQALDHWRAGEMREALEILNRMPKNNVAAQLLKGIHDGADGNRWHITFRSGEKY